MFGDVLRELDKVDFISDFGQSFVYIGKAFVDMFSYIGNWQWWVFLLIGSFIGLHMMPSKADMQGALSGIIVFLSLFLIVDLVLLLIKRACWYLLPMQYSRLERSYFSSACSF